MIEFRPTHRCHELRAKDEKQKVRLSGWVNRRRDLGKLIFIDLRDRYGMTQLIFDPEVSPEAHKKASRLRNEWVITLEGTVTKRDAANPNLPTGEIEISVSSLDVLSEARTPPFLVSGDDKEAHEELRLKYRYLDLRRRSLAEKMAIRHKAALITRNFFDKKGFLEIVTPILGRSTPEGARDYLVPSRIYPGTFYALPQSPQIFKQLCMIGGLDRYFQLAPCFRDEDPRADRQPEFSQIDVEMSFATPDEIMPLVQEVLSELFEKIRGDKVPKKIQMMSHEECMERYGSDRPDLRFEMPLIRVDDIAGASEFSIFKDTLSSGGCVKALCVKGGSDLSRKNVDALTAFVASFGLKGLAFMKCEDGKSFTGGIAKFFSEELMEKLVKETEAQAGDLLLFASAPENVVNQALDHLRRHLAKERGLIDPKKLAFLWVTDFPLFEFDEDEQRLSSMHHPFTAPHPDDIHLLEKDPLKVRAIAYDIVLNGYEIGGGSQRIHDPKLQTEIFKALALGDDEIQDKFGFFFEALSYGTPPHLGIALGFERIIMLLSGTENMRDVIAFPKTTKGSDLMLGSPASVASPQLSDLHIALKGNP